MKRKISLKNRHLKEVEKLSREQLKNVLGGWGDDTETGGTNAETSEDRCNCNDKHDCSEGQFCINCGSYGENGRKWGIAQISLDISL